MRVRVARAVLILNCVEVCLELFVLLNVLRTLTCVLAIIVVVSMCVS